MRTATKQTKEKQKNASAPIVQSQPINYTKPTLSFVGSFVVMVAVVLGAYWYGKQVIRSVGVVFRRPLAFTSNVGVDTVDPLDLFDSVKKKELILVDIRSTDEYDKEHIKGAYSLPSYEVQDNKLVYRVVDPRTLASLDKTKQVVLYGPSSSFQYQRQVVSQLNRQGYSVAQLSVGWNELRHFQNIWIPEGLWGKIDVNSIIENNDIE